jgi:hypothetical protein
MRQLDIADLFGTSQAVISHIVLGHTRPGNS